MPACHLLHQLLIVEDRKLRACTRGRCTEIRDIICDGRIRFMADRADDRGIRLEDRPGHGLFVKRPQVLDGATATSDDQHVEAQLVQCPYPMYDRRNRPLPLHQCRVEDDLHIWIPSFRDLDDIADSCAGFRGHDTDPLRILRDRLLIHRIEESHLLELLFQLLETDVEISDPIRHEALRVDLVAAATLIDADTARTEYAHAILQFKRKPRTVTGKHDTGDLRSCVLQCKVNMPGRMVFQV